MPDWKLTWEDYDVSGDNLNEVSDAIFRSRAHAGKTRFGFNYQVRYAGHDGQVLQFKIEAIEWQCTVELPKWIDPPDLPEAEAEKREFRRFRSQVRLHEIGHVAIYDIRMTLLIAAIVDQPAGHGQVPATKVPEYDEAGEPKGTLDRQISEAVDREVRRIITEHREFQTMQEQHARYDAVPHPTDNPHGTDHGKTQGAVLRQ
jgi:hypothetical protein